VKEKADLDSEGTEKYDQEQNRTQIRPAEEDSYGSDKPPATASKNKQLVFQGFHFLLSGENHPAYPRQIQGRRVSKERSW
jgi:hypothetical protein